MIIFCNPKLCVYNSCKVSTKKKLCSKHSNCKINFIPYYIDSDPFWIENKLINFQYLFRNKLQINKNKLIIKNMCNLGNKNDPITQERIITGKYLNFDINQIYPIFVRKKMFIYKLESLLQILLYDNIEIFTQTLINQNDITNIQKICKKLNISLEKDIFTSDEKNHILKVDTLQKFDILGTYFPIKLYDNITIQNKIKIYFELKLMWSAFCQDNTINEKDIYNKKINWCNKLDSSNIDSNLIGIINILINDNLDYNLKKMISYVVIGAFAYVDAEVKKIYKDYDFI